VTVAPVDLPTLDSADAAPCGHPRETGDKGEDALERAALLKECRAKHWSIVEFYQDLRRDFAGAE
jgi:hypothetical protein